MTDYSNHPLNKKFDLDTAISAIWEFYKKWFGKLVLMAFVFSLITTYITGKIDLSEIYDVTDPAEMLKIIGSFIGPYALILLLSFVFTMILQYYIVRKPVDPDSNIISIATDAILKFFLPLLVLNIILAVFAVFAITFGIILLFIGALFAAVYIIMMSAFMTPVLMIENNGIGDTINNTVRLAHKNFWRNVGWVTVFIVLLIVISLILGAIVMIPFGGSFLKTIANPENAAGIMNFTHNPLYIILNSFANALTMPLLPVFSLILYFNAKYDDIPGSSGVWTDNNDNGNRKVRVEDLYGNAPDKRKKELNKNNDTPPPTVEDLMP